MVNAQEWLDKNYPEESRKQITELYADYKNLEGDLDLSDFPNLKKLYCSLNELTSLNLTNCSQLEKIDCHDNLLTKLTNLTLPTNLTNLKELNLINNNFSEKKINQYGWCLKCYQPNTSENWCHPCEEKEWQEDLKNLAGQESIEKFVKKQPSYKNFKWIPYNQFTNIEKIGEGGFSEIYKAYWGEGTIRKWSNEEKKYEVMVGINVVLKILTNSQSITLDFLREIANNKLVHGGIVDCYGISQEPETGNYVMVMDYMKEGNLRQWLQNEPTLSLKNKLKKISSLIEGLSRIHQQNLVHRDFHSGNILSKERKDGWIAPITDLGLSCPVNYQKQEGKIFGVLPYVAPEVLQGQPYTQKSDIYSFGIIAYELLANSYPYPDLKDLYPNLESDKDRETQFAMDVCDRAKLLRPNIDKVPIPQELKDLIKRCWDADPKKKT